MIRCSTLHDLQCLCHQKCCTILIFQFQFVFTHRLRQSCHKNTRHERNCIPGMLNSVPFRTAALGTSQKKKKKKKNGDWVVASNCTMAELFFFFFLFFFLGTLFLRYIKSTFIGTKGRVHIRKIAVAHSPRSRCQPTILHKLTATV